MKKLNQPGFSVIEGLLIVLVFLVLGAIGYEVWHSNKKTNSKPVAQKTHVVAKSAAQPGSFADCEKITGHKITGQNMAICEINGKDFSKDGGKVSDYYSCWDEKSATDGDNNTNCTWSGVTYKLPSAYTTAMIRGYDKLPPSSVSVVAKMAEQTFVDCHPQGLPALPSEIRIFSVAGDSFIYLGVGCDSGHREILYSNQSSGWQSIYRSQNYIDCATVDKYKIPKVLFTSSTDSTDHTAQCVNDDGSFRDIAY